MTPTRTYRIFSLPSVFVAMFMFAFFFVPGVFAHAASASLSLNPDPIFLGENTTLTWSSSGTFKCVGTNFNTNGATSGTVTVQPSSTGVKTYSVSCYVTSPSCTLEQKDTFVEDGPGPNTCQNITYEGATCAPNGAQCRTSTVVKRGITWSHTIWECVGNCTTVSASDTVTVNSAPPPTQPFVDLSASPATVTEGSSTLLSWDSSGSSSCDGTGFSTGGATKGSVSVTPSKNTTYSILCYGTTFSSTPGVWQYSYTDITDLWCTQNPGNYSNFYTKNECSSSNPEGQSCSGSGSCAVNNWQTKQGGAGGNDTQYCNLVSDVYRCSGGSAPNTYSDSVAVAYNKKPAMPTINGPVSGTAGANHTFSLKAIDPDNDQIRYRIDWDSNGSVDQTLPSSGYVNSNTTLNATHSWSSAGVYTFKALTQDKRDAQSSWRSHTITIGNPAVGGSCSGSPVSISTGESSTWSANPTGGNGNYSYSWSGTDGLSGSAQNVVKTYAAAGTKTASVTITSAGQSAAVSCSNSVSVIAQCSDDEDNDNDGKKDAADPGCRVGGTYNADDTAESPDPVLPQCSNGSDDNGINGTDYPADPACDSPNDNDEGAPPPANISLFVSRWLVLSGSSVSLTWSATDVKEDSCTLSGTNGDSWALSGESGVKTSSPLTGKTVFTLSCTDYNDSQVSASTTVRLIPRYLEL